MLSSLRPRTWLAAFADRTIGRISAKATSRIVKGGFVPLFLLRNVPA
jgi:hypothetical protein